MPGALRSIELSSKIARALHELLVLLLLHSQLSLSLDADGVHVAASASHIGLELSLGHAFQEGAWLLISENPWAVCEDSDLPVWLRGFFNGKHGPVDSVVRSLEGLGFSRETFCIGSSITGSGSSGGLGQRQRWRAKG